MQKAIIAGAIAIAVATIASFAAGGAKMKITSSAFQEGSDIASKLSRDGGNVNPPLRLEGTPTNARSVVLIVDDADGPVGVCTHWVVCNIASKTAEIPERG